MLAAAGADVDARISLHVVTLVGETVSLFDIALDSQIDSLVERVAETLNVPSTDVLLSWGEFNLTDWALRTLTLHQLGLIDGLQLDCAIMPTEQYLDEESLHMVGADDVPGLAAAAKHSYVEDYRLRRQTVAFAEEAAFNRDGQREALECLEAPPWIFVDSKDPFVLYGLRRRSVEFAEFAARCRESRRRVLKVSPWLCPEDSDPLADYRLRRRTVEFAELAARCRESRRRAFKASPWTFPETSDPLVEYDSRRRTVEFAVQAAAERERRLQALLAPVSDPDCGGTVADSFATSNTATTKCGAVDLKEMSTHATLDFSEAFYRAFETWRLHEEAEAILRELAARRVGGR